MYKDPYGDLETRGADAVPHSLAGLHLSPPPLITTLVPYPPIDYKTVITILTMAEALAGRVWVKDDQQCSPCGVALAGRTAPPRIEERCTG